MPRLPSRSRPLCELLENRRLLSVTTVLSSGTAAGGVSIVVDGYGAFGVGSTGLPTQYQDFTVGGEGIIRSSQIFFSPLRRYLASVEEPRLTADGRPVPALPEAPFSIASPSLAVSSFELTGTDPEGNDFAFRVDLTQSLSSITRTQIARFVPAPDLFQTTLTQTYRFTNLLPAASSFNLVRYFEPQVGLFTDAPFYGDANGFFESGRTVVTAEHYSFLFPFLPMGLVLEFSDYLAVNSVGGTFVGGAVRDTGLGARIKAAGELPESDFGIAGDGDDDGVSDVIGSPPGMAQQFAFEVAPRGVVEFITTTTFAQGLPIQLANADPPFGFTPVPVVGDFSFADSFYNYTFPTDAAGALLPLTITVNRNGGSDGPASADLTVLADTTPAEGFSITPSTLVFAPGETSRTATITFNPAVGIEPSRFRLGISTATPGAGVQAPAFTTVNVVPQLPVFTFSRPTFSNVAGQLTAAITINRSGNLNGPASVTFSTQGGTAVPGTDFVPFSERIDFADNQGSATVLIHLLPIATPNPTTVGLVLTPSTPGGEEGPPSLTPSPSATLQLTGTDTVGPTVTAVAPVTGARGIDSVLLTFSEPLRPIADLSAFQLFSRDREGPSGSARLVPLAISAAIYDPVQRTVRVIPARPLAFNRNFQISVRPTPGLTDLAGNPIHQNPAANVPAFTAMFASGTRISFVDSSGDTVRLSIRNGSFDFVRFSTGEAATLTLFGQGPEASILTGVVRGRRGADPFSTIARIVNSSLADLRLGPRIAVGSLS